MRNKSEELKFMLAITQKAGQRLLELQDRASQVEWKAKTDFRTQADVASNDMLIKAIQDQFPDDGIHTEEDGSTGLDNKRIWVIDPLDGTHLWLTNLTPDWSVEMALVVNDEPIASVMRFPLANTVYYAEKGKGAWMNGVRINVGSVQEFNHAKGAIDIGKAPGRADGVKVIAAFADDEKGLSIANQCIGCASAFLAMVASGDPTCDVYFGRFGKRNQEDMAPGALIIKEAGGAVTDEKGQPWKFGAEFIFAANSTLHYQGMTLLNEVEWSKPAGFTSIG